MLERVGVALVVASAASRRIGGILVLGAALVLALVALFSVAAWAGSAGAPGPSPCWSEPSVLEVQACFAREVSTPVRCEEDEPCWDCTTMGNRICGKERQR